MNISRTTIAAIESGERKVSDTELELFSVIYGVSTEEILHGHKPSDLENTKAFSQLSEHDKKEVRTLIEFIKD